MKPKSKSWRDDVKLCSCGERFWPSSHITQRKWDMQEHCSIICAALAREERKRQEVLSKAA